MNDRSGVAGFGGLDVLADDAGEGADHVGVGAGQFGQLGVGEVVAGDEGLGIVPFSPADQLADQMGLGLGVDGFEDGGAEFVVLRLPDEEPQVVAAAIPAFN